MRRLATIAALAGCSTSSDTRASTLTDIVTLEKHQPAIAKTWLTLLQPAQHALQQCGDVARPFVRESRNPRAGKFDVVGQLSIRDGVARFVDGRVVGMIQEVPEFAHCVAGALQILEGSADRSLSFDGSIRIHLCVQRERPSQHAASR